METVQDITIQPDQLKKFAEELYQKAGVLLSGLSESTNNKNLFSSEKDNKINNLMKSIDNTNYRYGRSTLSLASAGVQKRWNMRRQYSSKIDTADFYCLPTIRA